MKIKPILFFLIAATFFACERDLENVTVDYSFKLKTSESYDSVELLFLHIRAFQPNGNENAVRTVYLESQDLNFSMNNYNSEYNLGSSHIEPGIINGYDISLSEFFVFKDGEKIRITEVNTTPIEVLQEIDFTEDKNHSICFELDFDNSISVDNENNYIIEPLIKIIQNAR